MQQAATGLHAFKGLCSSNAKSALVWHLCNLQAWLLQVSMSTQRDPLPGPAAKLRLLDLRKVEQSLQRQQVEALRRLQCLIASPVQAPTSHKDAGSRFLCLVGSSSSL